MVTKKSPFEVAEIEETGETSASKRRRYTGAMAIVVKTVSIVMPLYSIFFLYNILGSYFHILVYQSQFLAIFLFLAVTLIFLIYPATKKSPKNRLPWYDALAIFIALIPIVYICWVTPSITQGEKIGATMLDQILFVITALSIVEAVRRVMGLSVLILVVLFLLYTKFAFLLPGLWGSPPFSFGRMTEYMYLYNSGIFGFILGIPATLIIIFITFGAFLVQAGTAKLCMDVAIALAGRFRGGPAKVTILASAGFGTMSGSAAANVGTVGPITIPLMKSLGYKNWFAAAVETISSTGGVLMPPVMGTIAFIMASVTGLGYNRIVLAAIIPAILYYLALYFQLDFEAAKLNMKGMPREQIPPLKEALKGRVHLFLPIILLVVLLMVIQMNPQQAVMISTVATILVSWINKETRIGPRKFLNALSDAGHGVLYVTPACAAAGIIMGAVSLTGLGVNLADLIRSAAGNNLWLLAILTWIAIFVSGMAVGEIILYIIMSVVITPAFVAMGVPVLAAHMFIFYMAISMFITPPNCPVVFVACSIAGSNMWKTAFQAMKLGIVAFLVPFVILFDPAMLLIGTPVQIISVFIISIIGVLFLAAGIEGYLLTNARLWQRILFIIGGGCLFVPGWQTDLLGVVLISPALITQFRAWKLTRAKLIKSTPVP